MKIQERNSGQLFERTLIADLGKMYKDEEKEDGVEDAPFEIEESL